MDPMVQGHLKDWFMMLTMWAFFGTTLYIIATTLRRRQQHQMQQHVLDKFASAKVFAEFVQSDAGQKYVMSFADTTNSAHSSILNSIRVGVVLVFTGVGLQTTSFAAMRVGIVLATIGAGFLVSAGISFLLARKLQKTGRE